MCGIFGSASSFLSDAEKKFVFNLSVVNVLRGMDSSGIATFEPNKNLFFKHNSLYTAPEMLLSYYGTHKGARSPQDLFLSNKDKVSAIIGHCRAATVGVINTKTAHPFHVGNLIGVHNGTVRNLVPTDLTDTEKDTHLSTDSYHVYKHLNSNTPEETYAYLESKQGAFALVWFDTSDNTINFMRNGDRSLYHTGDSTLYFSSTKEDLEFVGYKTSTVVKPVLFEIGHHYKLKLNKSFGHAKKTKVYTPKTYSSGVYNKGFPWEDNKPTTLLSIVSSNDGHAELEKEIAKAEAASALTEQQTSVPVINPTHHVFNDDRYVLIHKAKHWLTGDSCVNCPEKLDFDAPVTWLEHSIPSPDLAIDNANYIVNHVMPLCTKCAGDKQVSDLYKQYGTLISSKPWASTL